MASIHKYTTRKGVTRWRVAWGVMTAGERVQRFKSFSTARDARAYLRKAMGDEAVGAVAPSALTVNAYVDDWLARLRGSGNLQTSTLEGYERHLGNICRYVGHIAIDKLTRRDIEHGYTRMMKEGGKGLVRGKRHPASPQSVRHAHGALKRALKDAVADDLLAKNPAEFARPPKLDRRPARAPTPEELQRFFDEARGTRYYAILAFLFFTGLRRGEVLALRRSDIDLDALTVTVERAVWESTPNGTWGIKDKPKRKSSNRTVALPEEVRPILKAHYAKVDEERLWWGRDWIDLGLAFPSPNGDVMRPRDLTKAATRLTQQARWRKGLQPVHGLRHSHATELLRSKVPTKVVSDRLGHSTIAITADLYQRTPDVLDREAAAIIGKKL